MVAKPITVLSNVGAGFSIRYVGRAAGLQGILPAADVVHVVVLARCLGVYEGAVLIDYSCAVGPVALRLLAGSGRAIPDPILMLLVLVWTLVVVRAVSLSMTSASDFRWWSHVFVGMRAVIGAILP